MTNSYDQAQHTMNGVTSEGGREGGGGEEEEEEEREKERGRLRQTDRQRQRDRENYISTLY